MPLIDSSKARTIADEVDHRRRKALRNGTRQSCEPCMRLTRSVQENKSRTRQDVKVKNKE